MIRFQYVSSFHAYGLQRSHSSQQIKKFTSVKHGVRELQDWDCADAMDFPYFERTLKHVKDHGCLPADMYSKEDQNALGESHVDDETVQQALQKVKEWFAGLKLPDAMKHVQICLIDGFLLFSDPSEPSIPKSITDLLDLKLFLRVTLAQMIERRGKRSGYVTLGDFWVDPPGYVEDIVWVNYVQEHSWMFEGGDADDGEEKASVKQEGIHVAPGKGEEKMVRLLDWGIEQVEQMIESSSVNSNSIS